MSNVWDGFCALIRPRSGRLMRMRVCSGNVPADVQNAIRTRSTATPPPAAGATFGTTCTRRDAARALAASAPR